MNKFDWQLNEEDTITVDWEGLADGEAIASSTWEVPDDITVVDQTFTNDKTAIKLKYTGKIAKRVYLLNVVTTTGHSTGSRSNGTTILLNLVQ